MSISTSWAFENNNKYIIDKLHKCILKSVINSETLVFLLNDENNIYVPSNIRQPYFYYNQNYTQFYANSSYIVVTENTTTLLQLMENKMKYALFHKSFFEETFVVVTLKNEKKEDVFKILWELSIIKIILIHIEKNELICCTSYPFEDNNKCGKYVNLKYWNFWKDTINFPKYPQNLKGCELNVGLVPKIYSNSYIGNELSDTPGIFVMPFKLLIEKFGLRVNFTRFDFKGRNINYKSKKPFYITDIGRRKVDVVIATVDSKAHTLNANNYIEFSDIFYDDILVWMIPKPKLMSNVKIIWGIFSESVWIMLMFTLNIGIYKLYYFLNKNSCLIIHFIIYQYLLSLLRNFYMTYERLSNILVTINSKIYKSLSLLSLSSSSLKLHNLRRTLVFLRSCQSVVSYFSNFLK